MTRREPTFSSLALTQQPPPDWADVVVIALPRDSVGTAEQWADAIFSLRHGPKPVLALLALRQLLVGLIGVKKAERDVFAVSEVSGEEALIVARESHLTFRCAVGVDHDTHLLRVTTAVWLHGLRGKIYFAPVSIVHDPVTRSMMRSAVRRSAR